MQDARANYLEIKRLQKMAVALRESFESNVEGQFDKGEMNFYQKELLEKQGRD